MTLNCLDLLEENLINRIDVLSKIQEENDSQAEILNNPDTLELQIFNEYVDKKGNMIDQLLIMDEELQPLFEKAKEEIGDNKEKYSAQILRIRKYIKDIASLSESVEASEKKNKKLAEKYFSLERQRMNAGKQTSAAAFNYYITMNKFKDIPPQFMDSKN